MQVVEIKDTLVGNAAGSITAALPALVFDRIRAEHLVATDGHAGPIDANVETSIVATPGAVDSLGRVPVVEPLAPWPAVQLARIGHWSGQQPQGMASQPQPARLGPPGGGEVVGAAAEGGGLVGAAMQVGAPRQVVRAAAVQEAREPSKSGPPAGVCLSWQQPKG